MIRPLVRARIAQVRQTIGFAAATGAERVVFCHDHPRDGVTAADLKEFARILSGLGREAAGQGVALSLAASSITAQLLKVSETFSIFTALAIGPECFEMISCRSRQQRPLLRWERDQRKTLDTTKAKPYVNETSR